MVAVRCHISLPLLRSKQSSLNSSVGRPEERRPSAPTAVVTKTWFSQMIGDERPCPGTSAFHLTFLVVLHSVGGEALGAVPFPVGPRQWAQFDAGADEPSDARIRASEAVVLAIACAE